MKNNRIVKISAATAAVVFSLAVTVHAQISNGGFETGNITGWTSQGGYISGSTLTADATGTVPTSALYTAASGAANSVTVVTNGYDPIVGGTLLPMVYSGLGSYSVRVNDSTPNLSVNLVSQTLTGFNQAYLNFAWAAVLQGSHGLTDSDLFAVKLNNLTTETTIYSQAFSSAAAGSSGLFHSVVSGFETVYYTDWQVISIDLAAAGFTGGQDLEISMLAVDCNQGGHYGYAYLDGLSGSGAQLTSVEQLTAVPEPSTYAAIFGAMALGTCVYRRRQSRSAA